MPGIEFLPESVDQPDAEEELPGILRHARWRWIGGIGVAAALVTSLLITTTKHHDRPAAAPSTHATHSGTSGPGVINPVNGVGLPHVRLGRTSGDQVLDLAVLGRTIWVLQADALHVARPGGTVRIELPAAMQDAQLVTDGPGGLVWLVAKGIAQAYDPRTGRVLFGARVPPFTAVAAMQRRLFLSVGLDVITLGPGVPTHRILSTRVPITLLVADPGRNRLIASYQNGPSELLAIALPPDGPATIERTAEIRSVAATVVDVAGAIWLAGYSTGDGVLMKLDPRTLRPVLHPSFGAFFGSGAQLVAAGSSSFWVRSSDTGNQLFCMDARTGQLRQSWLLAGTVASTSGRAVLGSTFGPLLLDLGRCRG